MNSSSEIICIHYYYPPIRSGGVLRNYYFSKEFAKQFDVVHVITTSNVDILEQEEMDIPPNVIIYKAATRDFRSIKRANNHIKESTKSSSLFRFLLKLKKTLPFHFYIGEGGTKYIREAISMASTIILNNNISHLYTSFMPYADHKIAYKIMLRNPHLTWIADFRDLQVEPIYKNILFPRWNLAIERRIVSPAKIVTTVSEGLTVHLKKIHKNVVSIPRGIELQKEPFLKSSVFTIAYTGNLFQHFRDGLFFVRAFAQTIEKNNWKSSDVQFEYAGRDSDQWRKWFVENNILEYFKDNGFVTRSDSQRIQQKASVLLMLSSSSKLHQGVLTGKLFEYLETPNPIINYINGVEDKEFEILFKELDAGKIFYPGDESKLIEYIETLFESFKKGQLKQFSIKALNNRSNLTWESRIKELLNAAK